jgi:hypothetical protein
VDPDPFDTDPDPAFHFLYGSGSCFPTNMDPDPAVSYGSLPFQRGYVPKQYFLCIFTSFSLSVGPTGPTQKVFFGQFSLPVNFVVLMRVDMDPDSYPRHPGNGSGS